MARIVNGGFRAFQANYLTVPTRETVRNIRDKVLDNLHDRGRRIGSAILDRFTENLARDDYGNMSDYYRRLEEKTDQIMEVDIVRPLRSLTNIRLASASNRRVIAAHLPTRRLLRSGALRGWDDNFVDIEPDSAPEDHIDYHRVIDGVFMDTPTGWSVTHVLGSFDDELSHEEKCMVIDHTWSALDYHATTQVDYTDPLGSDRPLTLDDIK